ncbi:uncharacterized protein LOC135491345 isoform X2 [Lineus longissimus]|uniref:uncharacterized protein LOC135491345 isoform X2 n=1 Tax=Lineus longissimus TaxID=88925 RepID=UPI00315CD14A
MLLIHLTMADVHVAKVCDHGHNVDACFHPVVMATSKIEEEGAISATEDEMKAIEHVCNLYDEGIKCNEAKLNACPNVTDTTRVKIYTYIDQMIRQGIVRFCGDKEMLKDYITHAACMHSHQNKTQKCIVTNKDAFIKAMRQFDSFSHPKAIETYCGLITDLFLCGRAALDKTCNQQAGRLFVSIASDFLPKQMIDKCVDKYGKNKMGMSFVMPSTKSAAWRREVNVTLSIVILFLCIKMQRFSELD